MLSALGVVYGDIGTSPLYAVQTVSSIDPAISVLSAIEGLEVVSPTLAQLVVPVAAGVLAILFAVQRWGTHRVGSLFGQ